MGKKQLVHALKGVLLMFEITTQCLCNTFIKVFYKSFGLHNISIESWKGIT
jgi:hypothetical protein